VHDRAYDPILTRLQGLHPKRIDLALDRIERLLAALDHPERKIAPVVHIAGTNGKGSTLAYLRAIAEAAALRVHVYTSPHLVRFNERIRVAGSLIGDQELAAILEECERVNAGRPITFFEITNTAAFLAFARHPADLCLLETGLGGLYDSTNVVEKPALTLITTISFDHEAWLGDTLAEIAHNKAGIIKPGAPCISSAQAPEALAVIAARAHELNAPLWVEGVDWSASETATGMRFERWRKAMDLPRPVLPGAHQIGNAGLALAAVFALNERGVLPHTLTERAIANGLMHAEWPARLQRLKRGPLIDALPKEWELWLDGAHNPAAAQVLARMAENWAMATPRLPLDLVVGMLDTKDARRFFAPFAGLVRNVRTVSVPRDPHGVPAESLAATAMSAGVPAQAAASVEAALADLARAPGPARVLITGTLRLAGAVLAENG
jgi:dihydrofolate synthase/folylpolyglutamate synthase